MNLDTASASELSALFTRADSIVDAYSRVLEEGADVLMPESALPATTDEICGALMLTLTRDLHQGQLNARTLALYSGVYAELGNFVPDAIAIQWKQWNSATNRLHDAIARGDESEHKAVAPMIADVTHAMKDSAGERSRLRAEFEESVAALLRAAESRSAPSGQSTHRR